VTILGRGDSMLTAASAICQSAPVSEIALIDESQKLSRGVTRDLEDAMALAGYDTATSPSRSPAALVDSEVVILLPPFSHIGSYSAQLDRTTNTALVRYYTKNIKQYAPRARILVAIPPVHFLASLVYHDLKAEPGQVMALSSVTASAHLKSEIANKLDVSVMDVATLVVGNDETIVALPQYCRVNGIPLDQFLNRSQIRELTKEIDEWRSLSAYTDSAYSLSVCLQQIVTAIALDEKKIVSVGTLIQASTSAICLSVPAKIGSNGVEEIIQLELTDGQRKQFAQLVSRSITDQQMKA